MHAHREESAEHAKAKARLSSLAASGRTIGIPSPCIAEFVRVATHPKLFARPASLEDALGAIEDLLEGEWATVLVPGPKFGELFVEAAREGKARGNLAVDAQIVAVCRENGVRTILTEDRDFGRFPGMRVERL